jgi:hypothetical protein
MLGEMEDCPWDLSEILLHCQGLKGETWATRHPVILEVPVTKKLKRMERASGRVL